jgi:hypothetical protein
MDHILNTEYKQIMLQRIAEPASFSRDLAERQDGFMAYFHRPQQSEYRLNNGNWGNLTTSGPASWCEDVSRYQNGDRGVAGTIRHGTNP